MSRQCACVLIYLIHQLQDDIVKILEQENLFKIAR